MNKFIHLYFWLSSIISVTLLTACGGGGDSSSGSAVNNTIAPRTTYTVTATSDENGAISPASTTIEQGTVAEFTITPDSGFEVEQILSSGCVGQLSDNIFVTSAITENCTVTASFAPIKFIVNSLAGENGAISPASTTIEQGTVAEFTLTPDSGFEIDEVVGCNGQLSGNIYTTNEIIENCTVTASFKVIITNNMAASALEVITPAPRIGYPLQLSVTIDAEEVTNDVGVAFVVTDKDRTPVRQLVLGTGVIEQVSAGSGSYILDLNVPSEIEIGGDYFVDVVIDALDAVVETNETDNEASNEITFSPIILPNLFIESMETDRTAIELDEFGKYAEQSQLGVINSDAGGTIEWGVTGTEAPIDVETYTILRLTKTPNTDERYEQYRPAITIAPTDPSNNVGETYDVPLYLWKTEEERYTNAYGVDTTTTDEPCGAFDSQCAGPTLPIEWLPIGPVGEITVISADNVEEVQLNEFDRRSAHLDFYFPGLLANELGTAARGNFITFGQPTIPSPDLSAADIQALRNFLPSGRPSQLSAELCVKIRPVDSSILEDNLEDNESCYGVALLLPSLPPIPEPPPPPPPTNPPLQFNTPSNPLLLQQNYANAWGGKYFGFGLGFYASLEAADRGVLFSASGKVPITVFGRQENFLELTGRLQVLPASDIDIPGQSPGFSLELKSLGLMLLPPVSINSGSFATKVSFSKEKSFQKRIIVGPIPVTVKAGAVANVGAQYSINLNKNMPTSTALDGSTIFDDTPTNTTTPNGLSLITAPFANVEVYASASLDLLLIDVGVKGVITLLEEKFNMVAGASINVYDDDYFDGTSEVVVIPRLRVINELTGAKGVLSGFVTTTTFGWSGFSRYTYTVNLANYTAWKKVDTLLDKSTKISIVRYPNKPPIYFTE